MNQRQKEIACARWLSLCLSFGWPRDALDWLEDLWWRLEGWRYCH